MFHSIYRNRIVGGLVVVAGLLLSSFLFSVAPATADNDSETNPPESDHFVVHEWGTFTTFSGSDGVFLDFRPLADEVSDLPSFVLDRWSSKDPLALIASKTRLRGRVRMETPVTYFYTDRPRTVNVRVDFPQGMLTEFYPPAREVLPPVDRKAAFGKGETIGDSSIDWGAIDLIPVDQLVAESIASPLREQLTAHIANTIVPRDDRNQHYAQARATDSALVHVHNDDAQVNAFLFPKPTEYAEKFLFYRGVGKFELPVSVKFDESGAAFHNDGPFPIRSAVLVESRDKQLKVSVIDEIASNSAARFDSMRSIVKEELENLIVQRLNAEGLYDKESRAMVETWKRSWFAEEGRRVFYIVPEEITNELLPLHIDPAPQKTLRVLVGRMELMSPEDEQSVTSSVAASAKRRAQHIQKKLADPQFNEALPIPKELEKMGRMAEPALVRIAKISRDEAIRSEAESLLRQLRAGSK